MVRLDRSGDIQIIPADPNFVNGGLTHATPFDYTQQVPLLLYGPGFVYSVDRDFVKRCKTPCLTLAGNDEAVQEPFRRFPLRVDGHEAVRNSATTRDFACDGGIIVRIVDGLRQAPGDGAHALAFGQKQEQAATVDSARQREQPLLRIEPPFVADPLQGRRQALSMAGRVEM